jgi:predicted TIM-barrel fold metal-dependent hydrolase
MPKPFLPTRRSLLLGLLGLVVLALVLLALPVATSLAESRQSGLLQVLLARKLVVAAVAAVAGGAIVFWLLRRSQWQLLAGLALAGVGVVAVTGVVYKLQKTYPRLDVYDAERWSDGVALLLGSEAALSRFDPVPTLKVDNRSVARARFPAIDVHFHLESLPPAVDADMLVKYMDETGIAQVVNLGGVESMFLDFKQRYYDKYPDRFIQFVKPDPNALMKPDGVAREIDWLKRAAALGARGVKENKSFGLGQRDEQGRRITVDDARLDPYWELSGKLGWPVLIHTGEPKSFWLPVDVHNERYQELLKHPEWSLEGKEVASFEDLMAQRERLIAKFPGTNFIGAHFGMNPDDLGYAASMLDRFPNYYVDMSSVVSELGRHPYSTREFFIKYQDRILFGTDGGYALYPGSRTDAPAMYRSYFEFLETDNEYIEYPKASITKQGNWRVFGIDLPEEVLEKVYVTNAQRLIPSEADVKARLAALDGTPGPTAGSP